MMVICLVACSGANESQDVSGTEDRQDTDNSVAAHSDEAKATDEEAALIKTIIQEGDRTSVTDWMVAQKAKIRTKFVNFLKDSCAYLTVLHC